MSIEQNKEIVRAFVKAINARDWERLDALVDPNFIRHSYAAPCGEEPGSIEGISAQ